MRPPESSMAGPFLGALLQGARISPEVSAEMFEYRRDQIIFTAISDMVKGGVTPDILTLTHYLQSAGKLDEAGGAAYVASLTDNAYIANIQYYAAALIKESRERGQSRAIKLAREKIDKGEDVEEIVLQLQDDLARQLKTATEKSPFITLGQYIDSRANKKYWEEYTPALFNELPFPDGTFSALGAAPGSGKSAVLVNLVRELLTTMPTNNPHPGVLELRQDKNAKRNILLISAEMTAEDITDRLIHSLTWQEGKNDPRYELSKVEHTNIDYWKALKAIKGTNPDYMTYEPREYSRHKLYKQVLDQYIRPAWGERLKIAYVRGYRTFEDITGIIKTNADPGTLVLMDYLQLFPPVKTDIGYDGGESNCPRYLQIRHVIDAVILAAEQTKSIIIAAAQLGRESRQAGNKAQADDTQGWRESGDIEQSGWNLIKIFLEVNASNPTEKQLSYRVVKCRSSGKLGEGYILDWIPEYQYMNITQNIKKLPEWVKNKKRSVSETEKADNQGKRNPVQENETITAGKIKSGDFILG